MIVAADVMRAIEANRERWRELGGDQDAHRAMLAELGFDADQLQKAMLKEGMQWTTQLPAGMTIGAIAALVTAACEHMLAAGARLGRLESGESPRAGDPSDPRAEQ